MISPMSEPESARPAGEARLILRPAVTDAIRNAGDARLSEEQVKAAARHTVAALASALAGDDATLAAMASGDVVHWLLHPVSKDWQVAPGPVVTEIDVWGLTAGAGPPALRVSFLFTGKKRFASAGQEPGTQASDTDFVGMLTLWLEGTAGWKLSAGRVATLDEFLGYVFTSRHETEEEYLARAGAGSVGAEAGEGSLFRITAGFAEHDERFGSRASVYVRRESAPAREDAVRIVWPAVQQETARALGAGDWQPSLNWLDVVELRPDRPDAPAG
jgi:hypothetical protein